MDIRWPELFSFAVKSDLSVADMHFSTDMITLFHLPLSQVAFEQFQEMLLLVDNLVLDHLNDTWVSAGAWHGFSAIRLYNVLIDHIEIHAAFSWIWGSCCQYKHKIFCWLLIIDGLNTRAMLERKSFHLPSFVCVLCSRNEVESRDHFFSIARLLWPAGDIFAPPFHLG